MLKSLSVSNLAVVEKAGVSFGESLNVLTGETGAGKSVLMRALDLVLGGRADAAVVREGAREAEVEAEFELGGKRRTVRRTVTAEGRSRCWIDDESVSVAELKELGFAAVDIHGPRANQNLLEESFQRETLDRSGGAKLAAAFRDFAKSYGEMAKIRSELEALESLSSAEDEVDFLRFQVGELEEAALSEDDDTLSERHAAASHAEELVESGNAVTEALGGDRGIADMLVALQPRLRLMAKHFPKAGEWCAKVEELTLEVQELSRGVADAVGGMDGGDEDLATLDARLTIVNRLKRKYRTESASALLKLLVEKRERLEALSNRETRTEELGQRLAAAKAGAEKKGAALTALRKKAATRVSAAVTRALADLGFLQARFSVAVEPGEIAAHGCDRIAFMFEPNPGEPARPLAAIASSGEIARVMLAVKTVLASESALTMVFDEIDANIGGEVGRAVGEKLRALAKRHQVIAITHLPQSAVYGKTHFVVAKSVSGGRTRTSIVRVEGEARVREIARMLGGEKLTSVTRKHAEELLQIPG